MAGKILTQARLKELLRYDSDTGVFTRIKYSNSNARIGDVAGCVVDNGYRVISFGQKNHYAHRLAWLFIHGEYPHKDIDHINHNRDDNRIENLRVVTKSEQQRNRSISKNNTSGVTGVHFDKQTKKWRASIKVSGKTKCLGSFGCTTAAEVARKAADIKHEFHANHGK